MFDDLRIATVSGGLTKDGNLQYTATGTPVLKLSVGSTESRKNKNTGEYDKKSHYWDIEVWGNYAEALSQRMSKGTKILAKGNLDYQSWESEGNKRSKIVIKADFIQILNSQAQNQQSYGNNQKPNNSYQNCQQNNQGGSGGFEDSIPF